MASPHGVPARPPRLVRPYAQAGATVEFGPQAGPVARGLTRSAEDVRASARRTAPYRAYAAMRGPIARNHHWIQAAAPSNGSRTGSPPPYSPSQEPRRAPAQIADPSKGPPAMYDDVSYILCDGSSHLRPRSDPAVRSRPFLPALGSLTPRARAVCEGTHHRPEAEGLEGTRDTHHVS